MSQWITRERRLAIYIRDGFQCQYCLRDLRNDDPDNVTLDHLTARSIGGSNSTSNLVLACKPCNSTRQDGSWIKFARRNYPDAVERIQRQRRRVINLQLAKSIIEGRAARG